MSDRFDDAKPQCRRNDAQQTAAKTQARYVVWGILLTCGFFVNRCVWQSYFGGAVCDDAAYRVKHARANAKFR